MFLRALLAILIIGLLAAGGIFLKDYYDETHAADGVEAQIQNTRDLATTVANSTKDVEVELSTLAKQYSDAQKAVDGEKNQIPSTTNPNKIVKDVLLLGDQSHVGVLPLKTQDWTKIKVNTSDYLVFKMTLEVNGLESNIINFVKQLQSNLYQTLVIENLSLAKTISTPEPTETETPAPVENVTANLTFAIYAQ